MLIEVHGLLIQTLRSSILSLITDDNFQTNDHALAMTALHAAYAPMIIELANNATTSGEPINRPVWWIDPKDEEALNIDDGEF